MIHRSAPWSDPIAPGAAFDTECRAEFEQTRPLRWAVEFVTTLFNFVDERPRLLIHALILSIATVTAGVVIGG